MENKSDYTTQEDWKQRMPQGEFYPDTNMLLLILVKDTGANYCSSWEYLWICCEYKCPHKSSNLFSFKYSLQNCHQQQNAAASVLSLFMESVAKLQEEKD